MTIFFSSFRRARRFAAALGAVAPLVMGYAQSAESAAPPPNVLFLAIDDYKPAIGGYGAPQVKTPHIDRFMDESVTFSRAFCQVPTCGASRASLLTSILPHSNRFKVARTHAQYDAPGAVTLPQVFLEAGYTTISNGKVFHFSDDTADRSWSEKPWNPEIGHAHSLDPATTADVAPGERGRFWESTDVPDNAYKDGMVSEKTVADLRRLKEAGRPFFLASGFIRPHLPFYAPQRYWDLYTHDEIEIASNRKRPELAPAGLKGSNEFRSYYFGGLDPESEEFHRMMVHGYYACASYVDQLVGDILNELKDLGLAENTIVVVWSDHGFHLGEHEFWGKHNTLEGALRVPLIIRAPGMSEGKTADGLVELLDLFPTLCDLAGLTAPSTAQGRSFAALLADPTRRFRDSAYARYGQGDAIMSENFGYTRYQNGDEMLFDWRNDPEENRNVAGDPAYGDVLMRMRSHLAWRQAESLAAQVPAPQRPGEVPGVEPNDQPPISPNNSRK